MSDQAIERNMSILNPTDATMMGQSGELQRGMSVIDLLTKLNIDPQGPAEQLTTLFTDLRRKGNPTNKMRDIAGVQPQQGAPPPEAPPDINTLFRS